MENHLVIIVWAHSTFVEVCFRFYIYRHDTATINELIQPAFIWQIIGTCIYWIRRHVAQIDDIHSE